MTVSTSQIILSAEPRGRYHEGIISGTPKPGTVMQIKAATALADNGKATWEVANYDADGDQRMVAILLEDAMQGQTVDDAYVDGTRCFLYVPIAGEEFLMRIADVAGTGDDWDVGDLLMVDDGTGLLIATTGSPESECFTSLAQVTDPEAEHLMHCIYTGY